MGVQAGRWLGLLGDLRGVRQGGTEGFARGEPPGDAPSNTPARASSFSQGVHSKLVQELLGHADIATTLDAYSRFIPSMEGRTASAME